jgi:glycosyltransferase involved in cell wall biosynthesis
MGDGTSLMHVAAIVPTMNEAETIGELCDHLLRFCDGVIVADDSIDQTAYLAREAGALTLHSGHGLAGAYHAADLRVPLDWHVLHMDAGGSHRFMDAVDLVDVSALRDDDVVIGSRFVEHAKYVGNPRRKRLSKFAARMMNVVTHQRIRDWTSGFRVYSPRARDLIRSHDFYAQGHAWQIESLWECVKNGCSIHEHPVSYIAGRSHFNRERAREAVSLWATIATR